MRTLLVVSCVLGLCGTVQSAEDRGPVPVLSALLGGIGDVSAAVAYRARETGAAAAEDGDQCAATRCDRLANTLEVFATRCADATEKAEQVAAAVDQPTVVGRAIRRAVGRQLSRNVSASRRSLVRWAYRAWPQEVAAIGAALSELSGEEE